MTTGRNNAAFTLIELLSAMTVLAILMLICGNVFSSSTRAWENSTTRVEQNTAGRAVMDLLTKQLCTALISTQMAFRVNKDDIQPYGVGHGCTLWFGSAVGGMGWRNPDEAVVYKYYVQQYANYPGDFTHYALFAEIDHGDVTNSISGSGSSPTVLGQFDGNTIRRAYRNKSDASGWLLRAPPSWSINYIADNVTTFAVLPEGNFQKWWSDDNGYRLPRYVDIMFGTLSEADARKAALLPAASGALADFLARNEKRFVQRVYFMNRFAITAPDAPSAP